MPKKILIVEDEANIRELLRLYLEKDGFDVFLAADGGEGIRHGKETRHEQYIVFFDAKGNVRLSLR